MWTVEGPHLFECTSYRDLRIEEVDGLTLGRQRDRVIGQYRITQAGTAQRIALWQLQNVEQEEVYVVYNGVCSVPTPTPQNETFEILNMAPDIHTHTQHTLLSEDKKGAGAVGEINAYNSPNSQDHSPEPVIKVATERVSVNAGRVQELIDQGYSKAEAITLAKEETPQPNGGKVIL